MCNRLCINHPFTAKFNFWLWPKIHVAAMSVQDRYSVIGMGVIYGVLAILCRGMKRRLRIVSSGATLLLPFTDKECGDVNRPCKRYGRNLQCIGYLVLRYEASTAYSRPANRPGFSGTIPEIQAVSRCPEFLFENPGF